jgi:hypothetical protein
MKRSEQGASFSSETPQDAGTGFVSDFSAVSMCDDTMPQEAHSSWKAHVVDLLSEVLELEPALASVWAHAIHARFSWFRGA